MSRRPTVHAAVIAGGAGTRFWPLSREARPKPLLAVGHGRTLLDEAMDHKGASVLVHRELIGDMLVGLMGGYLVHAELIKDPIVATSVIQEISGRPLGPEGRRLIPSAR